MGRDGAGREKRRGFAATLPGIPGSGAAGGAGGFNRGRVYSHSLRPISRVLQVARFRGRALPLGVCVVLRGGARRSRRKAGACVRDLFGGRVRCTSGRGEQVRKVEGERGRERVRTTGW